MHGEGILYIEGGLRFEGKFAHGRLKNPGKFYFKGKECSWNRQSSLEVFKELDISSEELILLLENFMFWYFYKKITLYWNS